MEKRKRKSELTYSRDFYTSIDEGKQNFMDAYIVHEGEEWSTKKKKSDNPKK